MQGDILKQYRVPVQVKQMRSKPGLLGEAPNDIEDLVEEGDEPLIVQYPPMITRTSECKNCYQRKVCSIAALAIEDRNPLIPSRKKEAGNFPTFMDMQERLPEEVKAYFRQFIECINLEQNAENDKTIKSVREQKLRIVEAVSIGEGMRVTLIRDLGSSRSNEVGESAYVNMFTEDHITFSKGIVVKKEIRLY